MVADKGAPLVGVELVRQAAADNGFLEAVMKGARVGIFIVGGIGDQARMIVNDDTQMSGKSLFLSRDLQEGTGGKVDHP